MGNGEWATGEAGVQRPVRGNHRDEDISVARVWVGNHRDEGISVARVWVGFVGV